MTKNKGTKIMDYNIVTGQFCFRGLNLVHWGSFKEYVTVIRMSLQLDGGI
jgi:hypothetical protein